MTNLTTHEIGLAAANVIRTKGLYKGDYLDYETGARCIFGAMIAAVDPHAECMADLSVEDRITIIEAADVMSEKIGVDDITDWNDRSNTTAEQVIDVLESL